MNKSDLIATIATASGSTKADAERHLNHLINVITDALASGESIRIPGFGTFDVAEIAARKGRNPQTGATITMAARKRPKFKAGQGLVQAVNKR